MWPFSGVCWAQVASQPLPNVLPAVEPLLPAWPVNLPDPTLFLGIRCSHQSTSRYGAAELQTLLPLFTVLMEFKPSPFSFLPFWFSPCGCFQFSTFCPAAFGEGCFSHIHHRPPSLCPLSARKSTSLPVPFRSPSSPLCTVYLLNSVVQVMQIVVLILQFSRCVGWLSVGLAVFHGCETHKELPCCSVILAPLKDFFF